MRLSSLGDIILASGLPNYIKKREPEAKVIVISGSRFPGIFQHNPHVDINVSYEKETRDTSPSLPELCKTICKIALNEKKIEIHLADFQNNKRSYQLLYLLKQYLSKEITDCELYLSHLELEKYRGAKIAMVWGNRTPLGLTKFFGNDKFLPPEKLEDLPDQASKRAYLIRRMLKLPYVTLRYYDALYGKGSVRRSQRVGKRIHILPEIWLPTDEEKNSYLPNVRFNDHSLRHGKSIAIAPSAAHKTKRWPKAKFSLLIKIMAEKGWRITLVGGPNDEDLILEIKEENKSVNLDTFISKGSIQDTAAILDHHSAVITGDTALSHTAFARRVPVFVIFGSTVPELGFAPSSEMFNIIQNDSIDCRPCTHIGRDKCPRGDFACMESIAPKEVADSIEAWFDSGGKDN